MMPLKDETLAVWAPKTYTVTKYVKIALSFESFWDEDYYEMGAFDLPFMNNNAKWKKPLLFLD